MYNGWTPSIPQFVKVQNQIESARCILEEYPGNPILNDVLDNWGIGHADVVIVNGVTYLYTATPELTRARYILTFR